MDIKSKQTFPMTFSLPESEYPNLVDHSGGQQALLQLLPVELSSSLTDASWSSSRL